MQEIKEIVEEIKFGDIKIWCPPNKEAIDTAIELLNLKKKTLPKQKEEL